MFSFLAGLCLGFATTMKPHMLFYEAGALGVLIVFLVREHRSSWKRSATLLLAGAAAAPVVIVLWLAKVGGLGPPVKMVTGYLIPYYPKLWGVNASVLVW